MRIAIGWAAPGFAILSACAALCLAPSPALAQQQQDTASLRRLLEARTGRTLTQEELLTELRRSGMSRSEIRTLLQRHGLDPALADRYFDALESGGPVPKGEVDEDFVRALRRIGVLSPVRQDTLGLREDTLRALLRRDTIPGDTARADTLRADTLAADTLGARLPIFGRNVFRRATTQFEPSLLGPADPGYRVGPEDELILVITGAVEAAYDLRVSRDGSVVIPDAGQVHVAGLTLSQVEVRLGERLRRVYSGVGRSDGATTRFHVSLGRLRAIQVYVIGDVERPGAYQLSAATTVFHALHRAGGPTETGSFRRVEVRRGDELVRRVDLYDYLLRGVSNADIRLEQGDIVFVPPVGPQVAVEGAVRRPAIYEILPGDDLRGLFEKAGGASSEAFLRRVQVDRVLPPVDRRPGIERVLIDVDVTALLRGEGTILPLEGGDRVQVFEVADERRRLVMIAGEVRRPGSYEWREGTSLWHVIERAEGLSEHAYLARAHIFRLDERTGRRRLLQTPLIADETGQAASDVALADRDSVVIFSRERLRAREYVGIDGFVKRPGNYLLVDGMTLQDLVLAAGGFTDGAFQLEAYVARPSQADEEGRTAQALRVRLSEPGSEALPPELNSDVPAWIPLDTDFRLRHRDRVQIRKAPWFEELREVTISGEVKFPGNYALQSRQERLLDLLQQAGGATPEAHLPGVQLIRRGDLVGVDLRAPDRRGSGGHNVLLEAGDSVVVPRYDPTVQVTGAVGFRTRVLYVPGKGLDYYIANAGGYTDLADRRRVSVTYQNGERATVDRFMLVRRTPGLRPGASVFVPEKPESERAGRNWDAALSRTLAVLSTTATFIIAIQQLK
jgi:polysaccharide biosynthesis/export protein